MCLYFGVCIDGDGNGDSDGNGKVDADAGGDCNYDGDGNDDGDRRSMTTASNVDGNGDGRYDDGDGRAKKDSLKTRPLSKVEGKQKLGRPKRPKKNNEGNPGVTLGLVWRV